MNIAKGLIAGLAIAALAGCSEGEYEESAAYSPPPAMTVAEEEAADGSTTSIPDGDIGVSEPQIAYRYELGFRLPAQAIKPLQAQHADMCEAMGSSKCSIIAMNQEESDGSYAYGNLQLAIAANEARNFAKKLETTSEGADAELTSSSLTGEDLSKQIVDTEARLRARTVLRDRLMETLRTRKGSVAELVEAERGVAQVNEEIDQARSWLQEMKGRVAFSRMDIGYQSGSPSSGGFVEPIRNAFGSLGRIMGNVIAFLIKAFAVVLPFAIVGFLGLKLYRWRKGKSTVPVHGTDEENPQEAEAET